MQSGFNKKSFKNLLLWNCWTKFKPKTCTDRLWVVPFQNCIQKPWSLSKDNDSYLFEDLLLGKHWANLNQTWPEPSLRYISDHPSNQSTWLFLQTNYRTLGVKNYLQYKEFHIFIIKIIFPAAYSALCINIFVCVYYNIFYEFYISYYIQKTVTSIFSSPEPIAFFLHSIHHLLTFHILIFWRITRPNWTILGCDSTGIVLFQNCVRWPWPP